MSDEFFYGATLDADKKVTEWNPTEKDGEENENLERPNKLIVKQILLGVDAKDEYHVVEVKTVTRDETTTIPIAVLKPGECRYANLFLEFPDAPVTFTLTKGSGPVHIHGQHLTGDFESLDDLEEEAFDEEDSDLEIRAGEDEDEPKAKKAKVAAGNNVKKEKNNKKK